MGDLSRPDPATGEGVIVACLDISAAARPVLDAALRLGVLAGRKVEALHVQGGTADAGLDLVRRLADRAGVDLTVVDPPLKAALLGRLGVDDVAAGVLGARSTPGGRRPVGSITRYVIEHCRRPLLVVPPDVVAHPVFRRAVVPLEGTAETSQPVIEAVLPLLGDQVEHIVLHVFDRDTTPAMLDRPVRDMIILGEQFLARHLPSGSRIEMHVGPVARRVAEMADTHDADLVVLSWSQPAGPGRAQTVMEVLADSAVPVLLVPNMPAKSEPVR